MASNSSQTTNVPSAPVTEEFIQRYMSLIIASFIGVIILGLLIAAGYMYLTKKKDKSNKSNDSKARSDHEPSRIRTPTRTKTEKTTTKTSPSGINSAPISNLSETSIRTEKSSAFSLSIV